MQVFSRSEKLRVESRVRTYRYLMKRSIIRTDVKLAIVREVTPFM